MTVTEGQILRAETIPGYLERNWCEWKDAAGVDSLDGLTVSVIAGGNVNYAFCLHFFGGKTLFLKQAPEFVAIFGPNGFPLTSERMQLEMNVYQEWKELLTPEQASQYLPTIYHFDKSHMVVIMEFLDGFTLLDHALVDPNVISFHPNIAKTLGDFMGYTHAKTHSSVLDAERVQSLTNQYENRAMRDVQLEFVFTKAYKEATPEQRAGLDLTTPEFLAQVELLKQQYNGLVTSGEGGLVLTHGDLHPGSVMVHLETGQTKIIDPEFTVYGPPGLDVGSVLSGYVLGAIHQAFDGHPAQSALIVDAAVSIWKSYEECFPAALPTAGTTTTPQITSMMRAIEIETVGFAAAEVCRTALEFAGGRKWLNFGDDLAKKEAAKKASLTLVQNCMIARHEHGIQLLWNELKQACNSAQQS